MKQADGPLGGQLRHCASGPLQDHVDAADHWHWQAKLKCQMKSAVKTKARKTNNQASFGDSLLQNNMEVEAAID